MKARLAVLGNRPVRTSVCVGALVLAMLGWAVAPAASAKTRVDYYAGTLFCSGNLTIFVLNTTGAAKDANVTVRTVSGVAVNPSSGSAEMSNIPPKNASSVTYDCSGNALRTVQVRTPSTGVFPSLQFINASGPIQTLAAGDWRVKVRR